MNTGLSETEKRELAGRSRTLHERFAGPSNVIGGESPIDPEELLRDWRNKFPDDETFRERLKVEGFTEMAILEHASATRWPPDEPLPDWIDEIEALIHFVGSESSSELTISRSPDDTAFEELLTSIASYAEERLATEIVAHSAIAPMVEWLVEKLGFYSVRVLYAEFKSFVEYHDPQLAEANPDDVANPQTQLYDEFLNVMFDGGFRNLCLEYPVLARQLVRQIDQWVAAIREVCRRIQTDRSALRDRFQIAGDVTRLEPLTDDTHAGGRTPIHVSFESGAVVYKPRPIDAGMTFYEILDRLDEYVSTPSFEVPDYLSRDSYGWMESIEYGEIPNETAVEEYYERVGALLCLTYILNYSDCQVENLIVHGRNPMLVDGETLLHPHVDPEMIPARTELVDAVNRSVLLSGLLPWSAGTPQEMDENRMSTFIAGLGAQSGESQLPSQSKPVLEAINTDVMSVAESTPRLDRSTNTATVNGEDYPPENYVDTLVDGFERMHETVRELHRDGQFLTDIVPVELVMGVENRLLYRPTIQYTSILESATNRAPLQDGVRFTVEMEELASLFFDDQTGAEHHWPLYRAERKALRRFDVPRFTSHLDSRSIHHDGVELDVTTDASGYELLQCRLDTLDERDQCRQCWLIRQSYGSKPSLAEAAPPPAEMTTERFRDQAVELFEDVLRANNGYGWVSVNPIGSTFALTPAGQSLYYGRSGIALTAAALYRVTDDDRYRDVVAETLDTVTTEIASGHSLGLGGINGNGSVVYVLSTVAELVDEDAYRTDAMKAVKQITEADIQADDTFDVMEGSAGTLLGLLAYYDRFGDEKALKRALVCGERLLEGRTTVEDAHVWETTDQNALSTGFAHGSSGIAYALSRLGTTADEPKFVEAAREALSFESRLFSSMRTNWQDSVEGAKFQDRWCHGRTGIALSRLGMADELGDETLLADAKAALAATASATLAPYDHLCCGNFGRVEALLAGSRRTDLERTLATELASRCLARRDRDGVLSLQGHDPSFVNPTFFNGISGVAYTLLRLRNPDTLPCVLLLE
jgi:type 2 lantibiotic biosynthesis protein LanM